MTGSTAYTSLEALLVFQFLYQHGTAQPAFSKISDLLKNDPQVCAASQYDAGRLTPDALHAFFLNTVQDETSRTDGSSPFAAAVAQNALASQNPRKRKPPSPSADAAQAPSEYSKLFPKLIARLYTRYREETIKEIRDEERRFKRLQREMQDVEAGAWDEKLRQELARGEWDAELRRRKGMEKQQKLETPVQQHRLPSSGGSSIRKAPSTNKAPPVVPIPILSTPTAPFLAPQNKTVPLPPPQLPTNTAVSTQPLLTTAGGKQVSFPGASASSLPQSTTSPPKPTSLQPPGIDTTSLPDPSQPQPSHKNAHISLSHHSSTPSTSVALQAQKSGLPQTPQAPQYGVRGVPFHNFHSSPPHPDYQGGVMLPPFQVSPQVPPSVQQPHRSPPTGMQIRSLPAAKSDSKKPTSIVHGTFNPDLAREFFSGITKSLSTAGLTPSTGKRVTSAMSPFTEWRKFKDDAVSAPKSPRSYSSRSVSPISAKEESLEPEPTPVPIKRPRRTIRPTAAAAAAAAEGAQTRQTRAQPRRPRGGSVASSAVGSSIRGRTRSQSVTSHADDDNESLLGRRVKNEPSTPGESPALSTEEVLMPAPNDISRRSIAARNKRKRGVRDTSETSDTVSAKGQHPTHDSHFVLAKQNFPRLSNPVMMDILSHKHASIFSLPVRDRDAEGYSSIIRRPQDLKSIKGAIAAGARAINSITAELTPTASHSGTGAGAAASPRDTVSGTMTVPKTEDVVPPKAIVNSSQLEKELMRMFANAVMFNPGEDDVVRDAREMFESATVSVANFRVAERAPADAAAQAQAYGIQSHGTRSVEREEFYVAVPVESPGDRDPTTGIGKRRKVG